MAYQKEDIIREAAGLWPQILCALTDIDQNIFNPKREHPCPLCGGKTRFRYTKKTDAPFFCNNCGARNGLNLYIDYVGCSFAEALEDIGNHLNLIPVERREAARREFIESSQFPDWYNYDMKHYLKLKEQAYGGPSPWQRVSGLSMLNILTNGESALIPLLNELGKPCDFIVIDIDGNWQTSGGNTSVPPGFYSTFGGTPGKRTYITVNPYYAAHASVFTQRQVICCYEVENIGNVANNFPGSEIVTIVASMEETCESDTLKLSQLTFNAKNNTVNKRLWKPFEIVDARRK